jgi:putative ABC transport system permease protein
VIDDRYFEAMGIRILRGRNFGSADTATSSRVAIVNDAAVQRFWPHQDPLGKRIRPDGLPNNMWLTIVGVVSDVRHTALSMAPLPEVYWPYIQRPGTSLQVVINTQTAAADLARSARAVVSRIDPDLPIVRLQTVDQVRANAVAEPAFYTSLLGIFSILALIMAVTGLYGLMSYLVSQRSAEIGIRQALGASAHDIIKLILKDGVALIAGGTALGLLAAYELTKLMSGMLFGVVASDSLTYAVAPCVLAATALLACYLPTRKALATDVMTVLRHE